MTKPSELTINPKDGLKEMADIPTSDTLVVFSHGKESGPMGAKIRAMAGVAERLGARTLSVNYREHPSGTLHNQDALGEAERRVAQLLATPLPPHQSLVLVGSSMGGWLSLLAARARPERLAGLVLIAAAPDFTERMLLNGLSPEDRATLEREGRLERPSQYSPEPSVFTWKLIEEGRNHLLLDEPLALPCPVRLLHGQSDPDVPWEYSLQIAKHLDAPEVVTTFIKGGDHRLSTPADIARLIATVEELVG